VATVNEKNPYRIVQEAIKDQLRDLSAWGGPREFDVHVQDEGDLWALMEATAAMTGGLSCYIETVQGQPGEVAPHGEKLTLVLELMENADYNRDDTGKRTDALDVVWAIKQALVLDRTWAESTGIQLVDMGWGLVQRGLLTDQVDAPQFAVYELRFETHMIWTAE